MVEKLDLEKQPIGNFSIIETLPVTQRRRGGHGVGAVPGKFKRVGRELGLGPGTVPGNFDLSDFPGGEPGGRPGNEFGVFGGLPGGFGDFWLLLSPFRDLDFSHNFAVGLDRACASCV